MATVKCQHCFSDIDDRATVCPNCRRNVKGNGRGWWKWAALVLLIASGLFLYNSYQNARRVTDRILQGIDTAPRATAAPRSHLIIYKISGSVGRADVTYENASGNTEQRTVPVPWTESMVVPAGQFVYISAQSISGGTKTIGCEIKSDGDVIEEAESRGEYVIATCSGSAR